MRDAHFNAAQRRNAVSRATACGAKDFFDKLSGGISRRFFARADTALHGFAQEK